MKKTFVLTLLTLCLLFLAFSTQAEIVSSGICGENLTWSLDDSGMLTISGTGDMYNYNSSSNNQAPWGNNIKMVNIQQNVTSIGEYSFYYCYNVTNITIPDSVTNVGYCAFDHCSSLANINIPNSVTSIGSYAFNYCSSLTSVTISNCVTSIGNYAFSNCRSLTSVTIPDSVTNISNSIFSDCRSLKSVTIPNSVTSIGNTAFGGCSSLTNITLSNSLTSIGEHAFFGCNNLPSILIPNGLISITWGAFEDCSSLMSIMIPNSIKYIDACAFSNCRSLTSVVIPNTVISIGPSAFSECSSDMVIYCYAGSTAQQYAQENSLKAVLLDENLFVFPADLTEIQEEAFLGTSANVYILLNAVESIGIRAFADLQVFGAVIHISANVISIADDAFSGSKVVIFTTNDSYAASWAANHGITVFIE